MEACLSLKCAVLPLARAQRDLLRARVLRAALRELHRLRSVQLPAARFREVAAEVCRDQVRAARSVVRVVYPSVNR